MINSEFIIRSQTVIIIRFFHQHHYLHCCPSYSFLIREFRVLLVSCFFPYLLYLNFLRLPLTVVQIGHFQGIIYLSFIEFLKRQHLYSFCFFLVKMLWQKILNHHCYPAAVLHFQMILIVFLQLFADIISIIM